MSVTNSRRFIRINDKSEECDGQSFDFYFCLYTVHVSFYAENDLLSLFYEKREIFFIILLNRTYTPCFNDIILDKMSI